MMLHKKLDHGFNGYQWPPIPRAARSCRRRGGFEEKVGNNQTRRMDALAAVVREVLLEKEQVHSSGTVPIDKNQTTVAKNSVKKEDQERNKKVNVETHNQGRADKASRVSKTSLQAEKGRGEIAHHASKVEPSFPFNGESDYLTADRDSKKVHRRRTRKNTENDYPFKKKKFFPSGSVPKSGGGTGSDGKQLAATAQHSSFQSSNSCVKVGVKSLRVPELLIEIAETATVGLLKRKVVDAFTAALGRELGIGLHFQGKKIKDDDETLLQSGIADENQSDALAFTLEPNPRRTTPRLSSGDPSPFHHCKAPQPLRSYLPSPAVAPQQTTTVLCESHFAYAGNSVARDHGSVHLHADRSGDKKGSDSKALGAVSALNGDALALVPVNQKSRCSETAQRRIRRPFSVAEVEALVQAVERIGTGRWRDVKMQAFDNANHRTYVDLKDKWKTLVHTARISPQQRRGEPVPQELLDRVLTAHAYWSERQGKQQLEQKFGICRHI